MTDWKLPNELPNLSDAKVISLDIETRDPDLRTMGPSVRRDGYIIGIAVGVPEGKNWYLPFGHEVGPQFNREAALTWARRELCRPNQPKLGANLLYDLDYLHYAGVPVTGPYYDVQVAEPLIDENKRHYSLESLSMSYLDYGKDDHLMQQYCDAHKLKGKPVEHAWRMPPKYVGPYAEIDVANPLKIFEKQRILLKQQNLWDLFMLETRLIPILLAMRQRGVRVDIEGTKKVRHDIWGKIQHTRKVLLAEAGQKVNVWANDSIAILFEKLGLEYKRTAKGTPSFPAWWLEKHPHPVGKLIAEERKWDKFLSTFIDGHILGNVIDGRVHCQFNQLKGDDFGTVTGRFSSSNPNLQQIPKRDDILGPLCRSLFIPEDGELWGRCDYSQIELRLLAHYANGPGAKEMKQAFCDDPHTDYHQQCADMAQKPRDMVKHINFGVVYGMGAKALREKLGLGEVEGKALLNEYHAKLPFLKSTNQAVSRTAAERGYVHTILNRRRRFPYWEPADFNLSQAFRKVECEKDPESVREWVKQAYEQIKKCGELKIDGDPIKFKKNPGLGIKRAWTYRALNAILQGSAADVMKKAMVDIWESGVCDVLGPPLLTVHDELDWSVPDTVEGREAFAESCRLMEQTIKFRVPLIAEPEYKANWGTDL